MDAGTSRRIVVGLAAIGLLFVIAAGGLLATTAVTGEATTSVSVATSDAGDRAPEPDELVVHVASTGDSSEAIGERVADGLRERGTDVTVAADLDDEYDRPVLVVNVDRSEFDGGVVTRTATVGVTYYYSTEGATDGWQRYRDDGSVSLVGPGAIVIGEIDHRDRTRGLTTAGRYRASVHGAVADVVLDNYRGALDDP